MWTDSDSIKKIDLIVFMSGFHPRLNFNNFSEPDRTGLGWIFHQTSGHQDRFSWWAVTTGGLFYEFSPGEDELVHSFFASDMTESAFEHKALQKGHRPRSILGIDLDFQPDQTAQPAR